MTTRTHDISDVLHHHWAFHNVSPNAPAVMRPKGTMMSKVPRWMFGWADRVTDTWGALPAEPILYFFMFTGMLTIVVTPRAVGTITHTPTIISDVWRGSGLVAPAICLLSWWLVNFRSGKPRLFGLWCRFAGDVLQAVSLSVFLIIRLAYAPLNDDPHIYLMNVITGVLVFVLMLAIRDVWVLARVEAIGAQLAHLESEDL